MRPIYVPRAETQNGSAESVFDQDSMLPHCSVSSELYRSEQAEASGQTVQDFRQMKYAETRTETPFRRCFGVSLPALLPSPRVLVSSPRMSTTKQDDPWSKRILSRESEEGFPRDGRV